MKMGLLWFDDDPGRDLVEKVGAAARRYGRKFGTAANMCYVHPTAVESGCRVGTVRVASKATVLRHHFWVGVEEERCLQ